MSVWPRQRTPEAYEKLEREVHVLTLLDRLARNIAVVIALECAFRLGANDGYDHALHAEDPFNHHRRDLSRTPWLWWPGCGRSAS